jgi:hypothetical protein
MWSLTPACFQATVKNQNSTRGHTVAAISHPLNVEQWKWFCAAAIVLLGIAAGPVFGAFTDTAQTLTNITHGSFEFPDDRTQVGDVDGDGDPDFNSNGRLWLNDINNTGVFIYLGPSLDMGPWGDHNNDGKPDLYGHQSAFMYTNNFPSFDSDGPKPGQGDGDPNMPFLPAGDGFPPNDLTSSGTNRSACWGDWDEDGDLDLFVAGSQATLADPIWPDVILNNGFGGTPQNFVRSSVGASPVYARGSHPCDYDKDGDLDIYVCNYFWVPNRLLQNDGSGSFTDVGVAAGVAGDPGVGTLGNGATIGAAWGDLNNDGDFDLVVANLNHLDQPRIAENALIYQNNGSPNYDFTQAFEFSPGNNDWVESYACPVLFDYDNDCDLDIFMTEVGGADSRLYRNDGGFTFVNVTGTEMAAVSLNASGQAAVLDWDDDGDLDLITGGMLLQNDNNNGNHWLKVKFEGLDAAVYGARVCIDLGGGKILTRQVNEMMGEGNQNDRTVHFGLGSETGPVTVEVKFLDGSTSTLSTAVDQTVTFANTCASHILLGNGLLEDLNNDCKIDYLDFAILHENYLRCNNPGDGACEEVDVDPPFDPNTGLYENFEGNPDITSPPWSFTWGSAAVGTPTPGNPDGGNLSLNHPDFTQQNLDMVAIGKSTAVGQVEFDLFHGAGAHRIHLKNASGWNVARVHIWGNGQGPDADISINSGDFATIPGPTPTGLLEAFDVIKYGEWSRIAIDWDMPNETISISVNGIPVSVLQNVAGMEPGYGNYANETVTGFQTFAWTGTAGLNQIDNIKFRDEPAPQIPYWVPAAAPPAPFFPEDFEDSPDLTAAPYSFFYNQPVLGPGNAPNTSTVMDPPDFSRTRLDLTHPDVSTVFEQGSMQFDIYFGQGWNQILLVNQTGWTIARLHVWDYNAPDPAAEISLRSAAADPPGSPGMFTVAEEPNIIQPNTWNTIRVDWDTSTELLSVYLNGAPLPNLQNIAGMEPGKVPASYAGDVMDRIDLYPWSGTAGTTQFDNLCVANEPNNLCGSIGYTISGNVGVPGVTLQGLPGGPIVSGGGGNYSAVVDVTTSGGNVIPKLDGFVFTPENREYGSLSGDLAGQDYTASAIDCNLVQTLGFVITGDITGDCYVNGDDAAGLSLQWLECNDPDPSACP